MRTLAASLVLLAGLAFAPRAQAVPILEGEARLQLAGGNVRLPITRGHLEDVQGIVRLQGRPHFGERSVRGMVIELVGRRGSITAKFGRLRRKVFALDTSDARIRRDNTPRIRIFGIRVKPVGVLKHQATAGKLSIVAAPKFVKLVGGRSALTFDQAFLDVLDAEGISPGGNEGAPLTDTGAVGFPISNGRLILGETLSGFVDHGGGLTFAKPGVGRLRLTDFLIDVSRDIVRGRFDDQERDDQLNLPLGDPSFQGGEVTFGDLTATLTAHTAEVMNTVFETAAFSAGQTIGTWTVEGAVD